MFSILVVRTGSGGWACIGFKPCGLQELQMIRSISLVVAAAVFLVSPSIAGPDDFHAGKLVSEFGKVASIEAAPELAEGTVFRVAFDIGEGAEGGKINRRIESAARFLNMHGEAGVPAENINVAVVVHGSAAMDLVNDARFGGTNVNAGLVQALVEAGVTIELCGQTAAYRDISEADLLPGVTMALSAMTAHALLQQDGYTLNPF